MCISTYINFNCTLISYNFKKKNLFPLNLFTNFIYTIYLIQIFNSRFACAVAVQSCALAIEYVANSRLGSEVPIQNFVDVLRNQFCTKCYETRFIRMRLMSYIFMQIFEFLDPVLREQNWWIDETRTIFS